MTHVRILFLSLATFVAATIFAQNDSIGCSCENPIYVDSTYNNLQLLAGTHWYKAGTYSLPLKIFYVPDDFNAKAPVIRADLGCNGHYENEAVAALAVFIKQAGIELPFYISLEDSVLSNGQHCYYAEFPEAIRHLLFGVGLVEEVNAYVEVTCESNGSIAVTADEERRECKKTSIEVEQGKQYAVQAGDTTTSFLLPINEWLEKGFQITWTGSSNMTMHMVNNCDFYLTDEADPEHQLMHQKYLFTSTKNTAQFIPEVLANFMKSYLCTDFYVRVDASGAGSFVIDTIAAGEADRCVLVKDTIAYDAKTQLLRLSSVTYKWNISNQLNHNVLFRWDKTTANTMYLSTTCEPTEWSASDPNMVAVLPFTMRNDSNLIDLPAEKINELVMASNHGVLYVHFENAAKGNFTMTRYYLEETPCDMRDIPFVTFPDTITIEAYDMKKVYKVRPSDWEDHKVRITWRGTHDLKVFFATDCDPESSETDRLLTADDPSMTFDVAYVNSLVDIARSMDAKYIYVHFQGADKSQLYFDTWKNQCAENTPEMTPSSPVNLLAEISPTYSFPIYEWKNKNMVFTWTGKKPVSLYISDTCTFSANILDDKVLDMWTLQPGDTLFPVVRVGDLIDLADEDGYLYFQAYAQDPGKFSLALTEPTCLDKGRLVTVPGTIRIEENRSSLIYKVSAEELQNNDVKFTWDGATKLTMYVGYFCEFNLSANNKYVMKPSPYVMTSSSNSITIEYEVWQSWLSKADEGYVYLRFVSESDGLLKAEITATHEAKTCLEKSTLLPLPATDMDITNDVVYRLDAAAWAANNVRITWSGATASNMTVADNCDMLNTIWSQTFVRSTAASGVHSVDLTKETIARWTPAADGFFYAKFSNIAAGKVTIETYTIDVPKTCLERSTLVPFGTRASIKSGELYRIEPASWKFDQLRAVWTGSTALTLELKYDCDATAKQSTHTVRDTLTGIESLAKATAPLYFVANASGELTFETYTIVVEPTCEERAQEVKLGAFARLSADQTYKISTQGWADRNIRMVWNGNVAALEFSAACDGSAARVLNITDTLTQVEALASLGQLLYFTTSVAGTILFEEWEPVVITPCEDIATIINLPDALTIPAGGDQVWMFNADAWKVNDVDFAWASNSLLTAYINPSCYDEADEDKSMALIEFDANETITLTSAELTKIASAVDTYAYVRFGGNKLPGKLRITIHQISAVDDVNAGISADTMVEVYTVAGQRIYSGTYGNMSLARGIYLIHTVDQTLKMVR